MLHPFDIEVLTDGDTTVAFFANHGDIIGVAKRMPGDEFDPEIGEALAIGRLFEQYGKFLVKEGFREVHRRDAVRERQQEASERALAVKRQKDYAFQCEFASLIDQLYGTFGFEKAFTLKVNQVTVTPNTVLPSLGENSRVNLPA